MGKRRFQNARTLARHAQSLFEDGRTSRFHINWGQRPRRWPLLISAGIVSTIVINRRLKAMRDARLPADTGFMTAMHGALRRDLARLEGVATFIDSHGRLPDNVQEGWDTFRTALTYHHDAEDDDLWPVLRSHLTARDDIDQLDV